MLEKTEHRIRELLTSDKNFKELEEKIVQELPEKLEGTEDKNINLLLELQNIIIEKAYLEGFKDGLTEKVEKQTKENIKNWASIDDLHKLTPNNIENASPQNKS